MKKTILFTGQKGVYLFFVTLFLFACNNSSSSNVDPDPIEGLTGTHTRVVWVQEQGTGADTFCFGENFKLMGFDSRDGKKERALLDEVQNYFKPILTPDGKQVIVSSRSRHEIYLVDFEKKKKKLLGKGVAVDVWEDPQTGKTWVYALAGEGPENQYFSTHPLVRFPIKKPKKRELVWNKSHLSWSNFDLSRDGKFAGGLFPWPSAGILLFDENTWKSYGKGCWTALSPDNSAILWVFDGLHRNLNFVNPFTAEFWTTNINTAPGISGFEVYHPRWSNHVRYLTMTGPYVEGEGGNKITGGGRKVEVYVGRFSPDLKNVEGWFQVTNNDKADFYPDVWLASGKDSTFGERKNSKPQTVVTKEGDWPGTREKLLFLWKDMLAENKTDDGSLTGFQQFTVNPEGRAYFNRFLEMKLNHSGFTAGIPEEKIVSVIKKENGFGVEFLFTPSIVTPEVAGDIFNMQDASGENFLRIFQKGNTLVVEVFAGKLPIGHIEQAGFLHSQRPEHLFLSLQDKQLQLYMNGRLVREIQLTGTLLSNWQGLKLVFGQPEETGSGLDAMLSHVAIYAGAIAESSISKKAQLVTGALEARKDVPRLQVEGVLVEPSAVPAPDSLGAYRRALVVNRYQISSITKGAYDGKDILVAQWAVLDRRILPEIKDLTAGKSMQLSVEKFDHHPELEGERLMMDMFDPDLELYYQVML